MAVVAKDIPILVNVGIEVDFHDHLARSDMEIVEHLVVADLVFVGDELYVAEHLFVRNEILVVVSLACVDGYLHIAIDMNFFATDVEFVVAGVDSLVADVDEGLLKKHYV